MAEAFAFAVTAGQVRAENSFSMVVIDPGHGGSDRVHAQELESEKQATGSGFP